jgi:hypothetical protein
MCRHLAASGSDLSRLPGTWPRPETTSARFGGAFRFPWPFGVVRSAGALPPRSHRALLATHWRRPETVDLDGVGRFAWDNSQAGRWAIADSACRPKAATRNFTGKNQRPCSIGNDQDVATAGCDAPFPGLSRQDLNRMTVDTAWAPPGQGSWPSRRPVRSDVMMGC